MATDPEVKEQARELRRQGLSVAQIAEKLGGIPTSTIHGWMVGVSPPEWTLRPRAKDAKREEARRLRTLGRSYAEIASALHVSKSSVSLWVRDLPHPKRSPEGEAARLAGLQRYAEERRRRAAAERTEHVQAATRSVGVVSDRELLLAGAVAYWAEGSKRKPWNPLDRVVFTNSDADMVRLFLRFLDLLDVEHARLRFRVAIHESADVAAATRFWASEVGVSESCFRRPTLKRHNPDPGRKNIGSDYHGCLVVTIQRSSSVYRQIEGIWKAIAEATSRLGEPSRVV